MAVLHYKHTELEVLTESDSPLRRRKGGGAAPTGGDLNRYTGTELVNHVSVRKYTRLQLFVETKRDGS